MTALCLFYRHRPAGLPFRRVGGLSLLTRAVLTAQKAGVSQLVAVVHREDEERARAELTAEQRLRIGWEVATTADAQLPSPLRLLAGDGVFLKDLLHEPSPLPRIEPSDLPLDAADWSQSWSADRWATVGAHGGARSAEKLLIRSLTKSADGIISRNINRKISGAITRVIAPTNVHPNVVTLIVALIGLAALPLAMRGTYEGLALAGLAYYVSAILDGVDGELSRLKYQGSQLGAWLDTLTDDGVCLAFLAGLFWALSSGGADSTWLWVGAVTIGSFLLTVVPRYYLMLTSVGAGDHQQITAARQDGEKGILGKIVDGLAETVFRTDFLPFFAAVTMVLNVPRVFAISFAIGSVFAMIETAYTVTRFRRGQAAA